MMRIVIVGAGIAGLSSYLLLKKHLSSSNFSIKLIDAYNIRTTIKDKVNSVTDPLASDEPLFTPAAIGSAIGITQNGLSVLGRLDHDGSILQEIKRRGHEIHLWRMGDSRGWLDIELPTEVKTSADDTHNKPSPNEKASTVMIARQALWEVLRDAVLEKIGNDFQAKWVIAIARGGIDGVQVQFADGSSEWADLVIGADGLKSIVRKSIYEDWSAETTSQVSSYDGWLKYLFPASGVSSRPDYITPHYEGLVGVAGFVPSAVLTTAGYKPGEMRIIFGPNGFWGHGQVTGEAYADGEAVSAWWSTFHSPTPTPYAIEDGADSGSGHEGSTRSRNCVNYDDESQHEQQMTKPSPLPPKSSQTPTTTAATDQDKQALNPKQGINQSQALTALLSRHRTWKDLVIHSILNHISSTSKQEPLTFYPTYTTPELPTWHTLQQSPECEPNHQNKNKNKNSSSSKISALVLTGDAAHTLQPSSGQGASQALEDADTLALLLSHYFYHPVLPINNNNYNAALKATLETYEKLRIPRLHKICIQSQRMSRMKTDLNLVQEMVMLFFMWAVFGGVRLFSKLKLLLGTCISMKDVGKGGQEWLLGYDLPVEVRNAVSSS